MKNLCCKIECLRQKMHVTALEKGISHLEVLMISCELDEVLNRFYKLSLLKKAAKYHKWLGIKLRARLHLYAPQRKYLPD